MLWEFLVYWSLSQGVPRLQYSLGQPQLEEVIDHMFCIVMEASTLPLSSYWTGFHITITISNWSTEYYRILLSVQLLGPSNCNWYLLFWATTHRHTSCNNHSPKELVIQRNKRDLGRGNRVTDEFHSLFMGKWDISTRSRKETFCIIKILTSIPFSQHSVYWIVRLVPISFCLMDPCCYSIKST